MASIRVSLAPVTRTSQPQFAAQVDWSNPITKGLVSVYGSNGNTFARLDSSASNVTTNVQKPSPDNGMLFTPFNGSSNQIETPSNALSSGNAFTKLAVVIVDPATISGTISSTGSYKGAQFRFAGNNLDLVSAGDADVVNVATGITTRRTAVVAVTYNNPLAILWLDGKVLGSANWSFGFVSPGKVCIGQRGGDSEWFNGSMALHLDFSRALSPSEIASLSANPWQIFK